MSYTVTTPNLQGSTPLTGKATLTLTDLPLDVTISTFSYEYGIPTVMWRKIEAGLCSDNIVYYMDVSNQTAIISKGPLNGTSQVVEELGNEPKEVVMWAEYDGPAGKKTGQRVTFGFTKTTTTTTTTTTTVKPAVPVANDPAKDDDNLGLIVGGAVGGVIVLAVIIIIVVILMRRKKSVQKDGHTEIPLNQWRENDYEPVSNNSTAKRQGEDDPNHAIYSELGPGGRVGPKPTPASSDYAEVKVDDYGMPITGETREPAETTLYDQVKRNSDDFDDGVIV